MPIQQPYARYNIAPMISMFDQQKTDTRTLSRQIARNLSDQKLQVAQNLATEDRIYKAIEYIEMCKTFALADKKIIFSISTLEEILKGKDE